MKADWESADFPMFTSIFFKDLDITFPLTSFECWMLNVERDEHGAKPASSEQLGFS